MTSLDDGREYRQARFEPPAGATALLLIRHGESEPARPDVPFPLVDGQGDPGLAVEGRAQAEQVCGRLGSEPIDAIYVSTLRRTAQTAAPLGARLGLEPRVEPDLREVHLGSWEGGLFRVKVAENDHLALELFAEERWDVIPGAEPDDEFSKRVRGVIDRLATAHAGQRLAVFTHGAFIAKALALAAQSRNFAFLGADNASISQLVVLGGLWTVRRFNETAHLHAETTPTAAPLT